MLRLGTFKVVGDGVHSVVVAGRFVKEQANVVLGNFSTSSFFASSSFAFTSAGDRVFNTGCSVPFDGAHYLCVSCVAYVVFVLCGCCGFCRVFVVAVVASVACVLCVFFVCLYIYIYISIYIYIYMYI